MYSLVESVMADKGLEEVYKVIFEALEKNNRIERMVQELAYSLGISILLADSYGHVMARTFVEEELEIVDSDGETPWITLMEAYYESQNEKEYVLQDLKSGYQVMHPIFVRDNLEGFCITWHNSCTEKLMAIETNKLIARMTAVRFKLAGKTGHLDESAAKQIISRVLLGTAGENDSIPKLDKKLYDLYVTEPFVLAVIDLENNVQVHEQQLRQKINEHFKNCLSYVEEHKLLTLFMEVRTAEKQKEIECFIKSVLEDLRIVAAISDRFECVREVPTKRKVVQRIIKIGRQLNLEKKVFKEDDYYLELICSYAYDEIGYQGYLSKELELLEREDAEKGTEFCKSLREYLLCGNNVNLAAKKIFVHRNTMVYRLGKIHEIMGVDINDPGIAKKLLLSMILRTLHMGK